MVLDYESVAITYHGVPQDGLIVGTNAHGHRVVFADNWPERARFWATREQMLSLARHGAMVCAHGRPRCRLCGNPLEPEGHRCPALNGHRDLG